MCEGESCVQIFACRWKGPAATKRRCARFRRFESLRKKRASQSVITIHNNNVDSARLCSRAGRVNIWNLILQNRGAHATLPIWNFLAAPRNFRAYVNDRDARARKFRCGISRDRLTRSGPFRGLKGNYQSMRAQKEGKWEGERKWEREGEREDIKVPRATLSLNARELRYRVNDVSQSVLSHH